MNSSYEDLKICTDKLQQFFNEEYYQFFVNDDKIDSLWLFKSP